MSEPDERERDEQWQKALASQLAMGPGTLQISRPSSLLTPSDEALWSYLDAVPPAPPVFGQAAQPFCCFSTQHDLIVNGLGFGAETLLEARLGASAYAEWREYAGRHAPHAAPNTLPSLFLNWAMLRAPAVATTGASLLASGLLARDDSPAIAPRVKFEGTCAELRARLSSSARTAFALQFVTQSEVRMNIAFTSHVVWASTPGSWYNAAALRNAFHNPDSPRWRADIGYGWKDFFGPAGKLARAVASLVVVDGITAAVTSDAAMTAEERAAISHGVWPFYVPDSAIASNRFEYDSSGRVRYSLTTEAGNPTVIGQNVLDIEQYLERKD
jgi:hypothetical protein